MNQAQIIFIVGPPGVGKSDAGFLLAQKLGGEIVSADSMQVYREVNIACDKPTDGMRNDIPHHLLDVVSVTEEFDVARYQALAVKAIEDIMGRGKTAVVVGGSGMYVTVLLDGIFENGPKDETVRLQLKEEMRVQGLAVMHERLAKLDPKAAARIHPNDPQRTLRALEVAATTGKQISALQKDREGLWGKYAIVLYGLNREREQLYKRIEARVDRMFEQGLVKEAEDLLKLPLSRTADKLIGVPEIKRALTGEITMNRAKDIIKLNTRHYAKRQLTWFRRDERIKWVEINEGETSAQIYERLR